MRPLGTQRGVVAMARVDDRVVAVYAEQSVADVIEKFLESSRLLGLSDPAGEARGPVLP